MNRAWAYLINKDLSNEQLTGLQQKGDQFTKTWTAHESKLSANFELFKNKIIVVTVNENQTAASGCSIDKLTRFIKQLESEFELELMNRLLIAYETEGRVNVIHSSKIKELLHTGEITANTIIYNTAIANQEELQNWAQPLKNTWLQKYLPANQ
ncbi:MAG: hypothetical protein HYX39_04555 [Bacteroidetes bacterium]|nr:hypothetical protein [Bacteroidota bacterium]